jgi:glycosyltransferase involved in cell wall biosynthesis
VYNISVIIPTYNRANLLIKTIDSVLKQTLPVLEILICDDGSTDNTEDVVMSFNSDKIKYIKCIHGGKPAIPRNVGISQAKGNWIAFLDSDDEWLPNKLESQIFTIHKKGVRAICSNALRVDSNEIIQGDYLQKAKSRLLGFEELLNENIIICSSVIIEKKLLDLCGLFNEDDDFRAIEDYLLWLKVANQAQWFYLNESLLKYKDDFSNSIRGTDDRRVDEQKRLIFNHLANWISPRDYLNYNLIINILNGKKKEEIRTFDKVKGLFFRKSKKFYIDNSLTFQEFEVDKWEISNFIVKKIIPIVSCYPYPLDELLLMIGVICKFKPTHIFEWGTHVGKSARIFHETVTYYNIESKIYSFDLPDDVEHIEHPGNNRAIYLKGIKSVNLFQKDGVSNSIDIFNDSVDANKRALFYLDGDHSYESVTHELVTISSNISDPIFLLHDTFYQSSNSNYNVGPYRAIIDFLNINKDFKIVKTDLGLPGMSLLYKL